MTRFAALALLLLPLPAYAQDTGRPINANWTDLSEVDPFTDQMRGIAVTRGDGWVLAIKCDRSGANSVYAHIISDTYLGAGRSARRNLMYRVDSRPPVEGTWSYDGRGAITTAPYTFLDQIKDGSELVVRATDYQYGSHDGRFSIGGAAEAIALVRQNCNDPGQ